jgi:hypothetical protein
VTQVELLHAPIFVDVVGPIPIADVNVEVDAEQQDAVGLVNGTLLFAIVVVF